MENREISGVDISLSEWMVKKLNTNRKPCGDDGPKGKT